MPTQNDAISSVGHVSSVAPSHTPGPWKVVGFRSLTSNRRGARIEHYVGGLPNLLAEVLVSDPVPSSACVANANLIAAAPELLEALKDLLSLVEEIHVKHPVDSHGEIHRAEKAISKAERGQ